MHTRKSLSLASLPAASAAEHEHSESPGAAQPARKTAIAAVETYLQAQMRRLHLPGAMLVIVEGEQIVQRRGFGAARPGGAAPNALTPFLIGSLTKSITALAVMQLVEAGRVELDAPLQRYLPWFRLADPSASARISVRQLLNQNSGLPLLPSLVQLANFDQRPEASERQARALAALKLRRPVGSAWEYSNLNYNLLGLVIEAASGETYEGYLQRHIFDPLGMRRSHFSRRQAQAEGLAQGHRHWFSLPFPAPQLPMPRGSRASGQLISCAEDLAHYLIAQLNGGRFGEAQLLSAAGMAELQRGAVPCEMMGETQGKYAMGWFEVQMGCVRTLSHGGNVPDFSAFIGFIPEQRQGLVLLVNADPYGLPPVMGEVGQNLTALLAGQAPAPLLLEPLQWVFRLLPLLPLLQLAAAGAALRRMRCWQREPGSRPRPGRLWAQHILPPLLPDLALAGLLLYLRSSGVLRYLDLFNPDLAWVARASGGFAAGWAGLRTALLLRAQRRA